MRTPPPWLESAVDGLDVALVLVGADRTISFANHAAHKLFGLSPGQLEGKSIERLTVPERKGELRNIDDVLGGGGARRVRSALKREDGSRAEVTMKLEACVDPDGRIVGVTLRYELVPASGRAGAPRSNPALRGRPSLPPLGSGHMSNLPQQRAGQPASEPASDRPNASAASGPAAIPPRRSEQRLSATKGGSELELRLRQVMQNLRWLEERMSVPSTVAPLDDAHERGRAMWMVSETRGLVEDSLRELENGPQATVIPAAPKVPKL